MSSNNGDTILNDNNDLTFSIFDRYTVELDWERYFKEFCERHGRYPVVYGDAELLLFPDGWMYSSVSYEGPEYPPPTDKQELYELQLYYWKRRYRIVKQEHDTLIITIRNLEDIKRSHSIPVYQQTYTRGEDGKVEVRSNELDLSVLNNRLQWLKKDMMNCKMNMHTIGRSLNLIG
jgi:hypothetical protein